MKCLLVALPWKVVAIGLQRCCAWVESQPRENFAVRLEPQVRKMGAGFLGFREASSGFAAAVADEDGA